MITIDQDRDMLGLIDVQPTFMPRRRPAGRAGRRRRAGDQPAARAQTFRHAFATQDWHPAGHSSFASAHPGHAAFTSLDMPYGPQVLWPDHAVIGTPGAELHPDLDQRHIELVLRKGFRPGIDSYSAFRENDRTTGTGLDGWLKARGVRRLFVAGLATDYCVAWSAEDAVGLGFEGRADRGGVPRHRLARFPRAGPPCWRPGNGFWRSA